jgi:hypothetical protein
MSWQDNAQLRERRATDEAFRRRESENKRRYLERKRAIEAGEAVPEGAALIRPKAPDPTEKWLRLWLGLNSESIREENSTKKLVREAWEKHWEANKPKEERGTEFGLADDYE